MFVHMGCGEGGLEATWTKTFCDDQFFAGEFKKDCDNFKKKVVYVNELLESSLYDEFLKKKVCLNLRKKCYCRGGESSKFHMVFRGLKMVGIPSTMFMDAA